MNKEHVFPRWLVLRCQAHQTRIRWGARRIPALSATVPLCVNCNSAFGAELESPVRPIFDDLEARRGITDGQAELLVRWMWKMKGLAWIAAHPNGKYTDKYTLRERVLCPIDDMRGGIVFAAALIQKLDPESNDLPMGLNTRTEVDAIFVSGVFSYVAMMAVFSTFSNMIPEQYAQHRLAPQRDQHTMLRVIHPSASFKDDVEAVAVSHVSGIALSRAHDELARIWQDSP